MSKFFDIDILDPKYDDIRTEFNIINKFIEKACDFEFKYSDAKTKNVLLNRLISVLEYLRDNNKLSIINENFINDTGWFSMEYNYINCLYAIYLPKMYQNESIDDYLFCITSLILKSSIGFLKQNGKNYNVYFENLNQVFNLYALCSIFLRRDLDSNILNKTEMHFFEIILASFLSYYYIDYEKIDHDKIVDTIGDIFHYHEFLEKWSLNGIGNKYQGSYEKEKFIAKSLIDNINITKKRIKQ